MIKREIDKERDRKREIEKEGDRKRGGQKKKGIEKM